MLSLILIMTVLSCPHHARPHHQRCTIATTSPCSTPAALRLCLAGLEPKPHEAAVFFFKQRRIHLSIHADFTMLCPSWPDQLRRTAVHLAGAPPSPVSPKAQALVFLCPLLPFVVNTCA